MFVLHAVVGSYFKQAY